MLVRHAGRYRSLKNFVKRANAGSTWRRSPPGRRRSGAANPRRIDGGQHSQGGAIRGDGRIDAVGDRSGQRRVAGVATLVARVGSSRSQRCQIAP